jgi:hypothetical protein
MTELPSYDLDQVTCLCIILVILHSTLLQILETIGPFGLYQFLTCLMLFIPAGLTGASALGNVFLAAIPDHRCFIPTCDDNEEGQFEDAFDTDTGFAYFTIPTMEVCVHSIYLLHPLALILIF